MPVQEVLRCDRIHGILGLRMYPPGIDFTARALLPCLFLAGSELAVEVAFNGSTGLPGCL